MSSWFKSRTAPPPSVNVSPNGLPPGQTRGLKLRANTWFQWDFPAFGWDTPEPGY